MHRHQLSLQLYHITNQATGRRLHETLCLAHAEVLRATPGLQLERCDRRAHKHCAEEVCDHCLPAAVLGR